jgi:hypothetical protein
MIKPESVTKAINDREKESADVMSENIDVELNDARGRGYCAYVAQHSAERAGKRELVGHDWRSVAEVCRRYSEAGWKVLAVPDEDSVYTIYIAHPTLAPALDALGDKRKMPKC